MAQAQIGIAKCWVRERHSRSENPSCRWEKLPYRCPW